MSTIKIRPTGDVGSSGATRVTNGTHYYTAYYSGIDNDNTGHGSPTNEFVMIRNAGSYLTVSMADPTSDGNSILQTIVHVLANSDSGASGTMKIEVSIDGTNWTLAGSLTFSSGGQGKLLDADIGAPWSFTQLASLQVRFKNDTNVLNALDVDSCYVTIVTGVSKSINMSDGADTVSSSLESTYTVNGMTTRPAGVGVVSVSGLLASIVASNPAATYKKADIASDSGFTTILATTGDVAGGSGDTAGAAIALLLSWTPPSAGTYYVRIGTKTPNFTTYAYNQQSVVVGFPTGVTLTPSVNGNRVTLTLVMTDTYSKPPNVTFAIDGDMLMPEIMARTGSGPYTYTFTATAEVETGEHRVSCVLGNVWTTILLPAQMIYAPLVRYDPRVEVYRGNEQLEVDNIEIVERFLPNVSEARFTVLPGVMLSGNLTIKQYGGGLKIHRMIVSSQQDREITCKSAFSRIVQSTKRVQLLSIAQADLMAQLVAPSILCERTDLLTGTRELLDVEDTIGNLVADASVVCGVQLYERGGRVHVLPLVPAVDAVMVMQPGDPGVIYAKNYDSIVNRIRQYYAIEQLPVPDNAMTNHDAAQWTGTVTDVQQTNRGLLPKSGAPWMQKIVGLGTHPITFSLDDYDELTGNWSPEALSRTLQLRLYSSSTDYWLVSRPFGGSLGAGIALTGNSSDSEVSQTIALANIRLERVQVATSNTCQVKITLKKGTTVQFESAYMTSDQNGRIILIPEAVYKADYADTLILTFTRLYPVGVSYGVTVSSVTGREYYSYLSAVPGAEVYDWTETRDYLMGATPSMTGAVGTVQPAQHLAAPVRTVPAGCRVGGTRYFLRYKVYVSTGSGVGTLLRSFDMGLPSGDIAHPSYGRAWVQDSQLYIDEPVAPITIGDIPAGEAWCIETHAEVTLYTTKATTEAVTLWDYRDWSYGTTYPLWDKFAIPLVGKTIGSGSPTNLITKVGVQTNATDTFYLDTLSVRARNRKWRTVEIQDDDSITKYGERLAERKLDSVYSEAAARILANGFLAIGKDPAVTYSATFPATAHIELGMPVATSDGTLIVTQLSSANGTQQVQVGSPSQSLRDKLTALARKQDALQRVL